MLISIPYHLVFRIGLGVFSDLPKHKPDQSNPSGAAEVSLSFICLSVASGLTLLEGVSA